MLVSKPVSSTLARESGSSLYSNYWWLRVKLGKQLTEKCSFCQCKPIHTFVLNSPKVENERQRKARLAQILLRAQPPALLAGTQAHSSALQGSQGMDAPAARTSEMDPSTPLLQLLHWYKIPKYGIQTGPGMPKIPALTQSRFNSARQSRTCLRGNKHW